MQLFVAVPLGPPEVTAFTRKTQLGRRQKPVTFDAIVASAAARRARGSSVPACNCHHGGQFNTQVNSCKCV